MSENIDAAEVNKFNQLANSWWDEEGENRALHDLNPCRLGYVLDHVQIDGSRVLDVGCGGGLLSESMAKHGGEVLGIDVADKLLKIAQLHAFESASSVRYELATVETLAARKPAHYQVITCMEMLEHVPQPQAVVVSCAQALAPGGKVFFSTLTRTPTAFALGIVAAEYLINLVPRGTHEYAKFIKPSELAGWVRAAGLDLVDISGMSYNPLTRSAQLSDNVRVNYLLCAEKPAQDILGNEPIRPIR